MTPTEQDKKLRQKMQDIFNDCTSGWLITIKNFNGYERELRDMESEIIGDILDLITADRKRVELEARINELEQVSVDSWGAQHVPEPRQYRDGYVIGVKELDERIDELKDQQEKL